MNIEITALAAGTLVFFSIAVLGMVMALRLRTIRKKNKIAKHDRDWKESKAKTVEDYNLKTNAEQTKPNAEQTKPNPEQTKPNEPIDTDALLRDLKDKEQS